ncbi:hypothetical protein [Streptomyces gobiensis]|uniref:hypothetical protein n=1 Tax=Streptomyces gobiensis TaxID=2875706 RepID=UPI001E6032FD|nr:hypothetical protein [Streptomyces gobiensis]UGY93510.1 hypothetical protein test1122_18465 [Streptomyces gobiensis]
MAVKNSVLAAAVSVVVLSLAGCSSGGGADGEKKDEGERAEQTGQADLASRPAEEIRDTAVKAMKSAKSFTAEGTITPADEILTMKVSVSDAQCTGSAETGDSGGFQMRGKDGAYYMKPDNAFVEGKLAAFLPEAARQAKGKWLKFKGDNQFGLCDKNTMVDSLMQTPGSNGSGLRKGKPAKLDGTPVIPVTSEDKKSGSTVTFYIADDEAKPYILKREVEAKDGDKPGTVTFSDFGKAVKAETPPKDQTVDVGGLGR